MCIKKEKHRSEHTTNREEGRRKVIPGRRQEGYTPTVCRTLYLCWERARMWGLFLWWLLCTRTHPPHNIRVCFSVVTCGWQWWWVSGGDMEPCRILNFVSSLGFVRVNLFAASSFVFICGHVWTKSTLLLISRYDSFIHFVLFLTLPEDWKDVMEHKLYWNSSSSSSWTSREEEEIVLFQFDIFNSFPLQVCLFVQSFRIDKNGVSHLCDPPSTDRPRRRSLHPLIEPFICTVQILK